MGSDPPSFNLEHILRTFERNGVEYVLVGGLGARAHGANRPTEDVDFVPRSTPDNLSRLAAAPRELGARLRVGGMSDDEARRLPVVIDGATLAAFGSSTWLTDAGPIDVLHDLPTNAGRLGYEALLSTATTAHVEGLVLQVAALSEIIASKRHADRPKDREALPELEELEERTHRDTT